MTSRWRWGLVAVLAVGLVWLTAGSSALDPGPSVYSKRAGGWMLARHYLEARGIPVEVVTRPLEELVTTEPAGVLVLAFPWRRPASEQELMAIDRLLRRGGTVVVATSGGAGGPIEERVLDRLGLSLVRHFERPPVWLPDWWRLRRDGRRLVSPAGERPDLHLSHGLAWGASAPPGARVHYRALPEGAGETNGGVAMVFETTHQGGRVVVLPAELLANGWLASAEQGPAHGALLESLRQGLATAQTPWRFDEYHLGSNERKATLEDSHRRSWDLFAIHLLVLYALGLIALARGFGPVFAHERVRSGSAGTFLRGLGALHHRLGHHAAAARRLVERARRNVPDDLWDESFDRRAATVRDGAGLLALAQDIADHPTRNHEKRRRS